MGNKFFCGLKNKSSKSKGKGKKKKLPVPREILSSCEYESDTIDHTSQEILDENFKREITTGIDEHMATIPTAFQAERDRIVNEMKRFAPQRYLGLLYSEYPDENGRMVDELAKRIVTSKENKRKVIDKITAHVEPLFESRTADWNESSREGARPMIKIFIEKLVNEAFEHVSLK